jgi:hypothetical protein
LILRLWTFSLNSWLNFAHRQPEQRCRRPPIPSIWTFAWCLFKLEFLSKLEHRRVECRSSCTREVLGLWTNARSRSYIIENII